MEVIGRREREVHLGGTETTGFPGLMLLCPSIPWHVFFSLSLWESEHRAKEQERTWMVSL